MSTATAATKTKAAAPKAGARRKKKGVQQVATGRAYIQATFNNTIVTFTDVQGNVLGWSSSGKVGFTGPKKSTPFAATMIVKDLVERVVPATGLKDVHVLVKGVGAGRESAIRALNAHGLGVLSIKDVTPVPHNGCRPPKPRRI